MLFRVYYSCSLAGEDPEADILDSCRGSEEDIAEEGTVEGIAEAVSYTHLTLPTKA